MGDALGGKRVAMITGPWELLARAVDLPRVTIGQRRMMLHLNVELLEPWHGRLPDKSFAAGPGRTGFLVLPLADPYPCWGLCRRLQRDENIRQHATRGERWPAPLCRHTFAAETTNRADAL